jgi:hypothetical protein
VSDNLNPEYRDCLQCGHCDFCIDRSIDDFEFHEDSDEWEDDCQSCGNTGWIGSGDGISIECGECNS